MELSRYYAIRSGGRQGLVWIQMCPLVANRILPKILWQRSFSLHFTNDFLCAFTPWEGRSIWICILCAWIYSAGICDGAPSTDYLVCNVKCPGGLVSSLFKLGHCDLILRFYGTMYVKHIFNFSLTTTWISLLFCSELLLSMINQVQMVSVWPI